ncbi:mandelate racemase/muconate lactonizing enzyme family protein (plasmid) [Agrobacterium tumefaciens]|uniref:Mandelate racemase/muconate lactonizing enzyme family protein n=1 Tax=Agrobacterium tumefaciens TaxID=358 RepID=A0AAP9E9X6_AGRTU|nr:mandelate racemase/muconate lactonizing enzyme family protein [Agrobacterium tumefaciens]NSZ60120.1 mandelate racemase/muconate lactonizing enzyme family protein [Agrobacterium tumefaciens]QDY97716.1 mandelate racemase/muconate lactonizing enzyme family protein [Agrobacterium tumefaciens]UXS12840.1 mandelate racemase/muconate lactonizing enzyme family protein [Agrobacterium tumefaciens]UXS20202.1 mandelate racemase/muconate lactonizing enzyme family protein [Agrobacterium tumefaciens]UXS278
MKITKVTSEYYSWPRPVPLTNGVDTWTDVRRAVVKIETDEGITGIGVGGAAAGERQFRDAFAAKLIDQDPLLTERIWASLWSPKLSGRRGYETRALSSIDFALWDIKGKAAGLPLYKLLGGYRNRVASYVAGGYYGPDKTIKDLQAEMVRYVERGAKAVKMKVGAVALSEDVARVKAVREAIGPDIRLMIDVNCAYRYYEAIQFSRRVEDFDIFWLEEPVQPDDYEGMEKIARASSIPLAAGENEYTKFGFRDLIATQSVAILQPDARWMGGVTEFIKVASMAEAHGLDIAAHGDQQVHLHLLGAIPNALYLEYYPVEFDPMHGQVYLETPKIQADGSVELLETPGLGLAHNEEALAKYRISL